MHERSSKKQRELLTFVDNFIQSHGYGPSYREVMRALGYKSVSTVATHIDGLIEKAASGYMKALGYAPESPEATHATDRLYEAVRNRPNQSSQYPTLPEYF